MGTNSFAKIGRIGLAALKQRQYWDTSKGVKQGSQLEAALELLRDFFHRIPPRVVDLIKPSRKPIVVYSDASWPSERDGDKSLKIPRIGWVIFIEGQRPVAFSMVVGKSITENLLKRKQQILSVEAFAAIAATSSS